MFPTFSGTSRRPRQVNLSGRKTHAFGNTGTGTGSQAALDRAQQERAQRQRERETLKAAQILQRLWRGHSCRKRVADVLRKEWDLADESSVCGQDSSRLDPYLSEEQSLVQLQRLTRFSNARDAHDIQRIRHYGLRQINTARSHPMAVSGPWPLAYLRLEKIMLSVLDRCAAEMDAHLDLFLDFLTILHFVVDQIPSETSQNAEPFYRTFASVITKQCSMMENFPGDSKYTNALKESLETVITPLKRVTGYTLNAYEAFGYNSAALSYRIEVGCCTSSSRIARCVHQLQVARECTCNVFQGVRHIFPFPPKGPWGPTTPSGHFHILSSTCTQFSISRSIFSTSRFRRGGLRAS
jgi:ubiquitin-protein ligase E3 C